MRFACFMFGVGAGVLAGAFALVAVGQVLYSGLSGDVADRFVRERAFYQWSSLVSGFATLSGLSFVAAAIFQHAESPRGSGTPARSRLTPGTEPGRSYTLPGQQ